MPTHAVRRMRALVPIVAAAGVALAVAALAAWSACDVASHQHLHDRRIGSIKGAKLQGAGAVSERRRPTTRVVTPHVRLTRLAARGAGNSVASRAKWAVRTQVGSQRRPDGGAIPLNLGP